MTTNELTTAPGRYVEMTNKHLANTVRFGRRVTFLTPELPDDVVGYVTGFDDDNVRIATVTMATDGQSLRVDVKLRHRRYIGGIDEDRYHTYKQESDKVTDTIETLVRDFRKMVMKEYFPQHPVRDD